MRSDPVTVEVPAKINLALKVAPVGADNFHELITLFHAVSLFDTVTAKPGIHGATLHIEGEGVDTLPVDDSNLAVKAAKLLAAHHGVEPNVDLHIVKRIPISGGMAGGSADAAGTLIACDRLWETNTPRGDLENLAAQLGSDVTFALHGGTALGSGRGELLTSVITTGEYHWVIALAKAACLRPLCIPNSIARRWPCPVGDSIFLPSYFWRFERGIPKSLDRCCSMTWSRLP